MKVWDVIISGAGIIGVSLALELRERGAAVLVLDSREPGKEASSAAAGMLAASDPETPAKLRPLTYAGARLYPQFAGKLERLSGVQTDFRRGAIALLADATVPPEHRLLSAAELHQLEPAIRAGMHSAAIVENENSVDPDLLMQAALPAARAAGIEFRGQTAVQQMRATAGQIEVIAGKERFPARTAVNCQGAWSGAPVRPRKGQMLYLQPQKPGLLGRVLRTPEVYLVPRSSGKILVGATVEDVGFDKSVESEVIQDLHRCAARFVPQLASAATVSSWAGLRPGTPDDLPILGPTEIPGTFIASGHFRNGILLAPITARIMADLIAGKSPELDISAFSPARFANVTL
ncbi:MAG TPA: FAD-dependent oxidoreductase [Candidatus Angelobacter sp.]